MSEKAKGSIYGRLARVLSEVENVPKNGRNDYDGYSYVLAADLVDHLRPLLAKNGLAILVGFSDFVDLEDGRVKVLGSVRIGDDDGNEIEVPIVGEAKDVSKDGRRKDKAVFKAMTGAYKRWLEKTFMISTEEDEPERPLEHERPATATHPPQEPRPAAPRPTAAPRRDIHATPAVTGICPDCGQKTIIKGKPEYGGGWVCYKKKGGCGHKWPDGDPAIEGADVGTGREPGQDDEPPPFTEEEHEDMFPAEPRQSHRMIEATRQAIADCMDDKRAPVEVRRGLGEYLTDHAEGLRVLSEEDARLILARAKAAIAKADVPELV